MAAGVVDVPYQASPPCWPSSSILEYEPALVPLFLCRLLPQHFQILMASHMKKATLTAFHIACLIRGLWPSFFERLRSVQVCQHGTGRRRDQELFRQPQRRHKETG